MSTESSSRSFPQWFVPNCPSEDAVEAEGIIFRFVKANPVDPEEFRSYHETGERPNGPSCQRCGLSVFRKLEDVRSFLRHLWKAYPGKNFGPHVVKRELTPTDGKTKPTGKHGHQTWWAYEGVERHAAFEYVETVEKR